jgi:prevent-host-death family protein
MMAEQNPVTETMAASAVRNHFAEAINKVAKDETRIIVEKNGVPVAAIVPIADLKRIKKADIDRAEAWKLLNEVRSKFQGVSNEELEREALKAVAEVRAEMKAERERALAGASE